MGRNIPDTSGGNSFSPTALMKEEGKMIKGKMLARREVETMYGSKPIYSLQVLDATCEFTQGQERVQPTAGASVDLFASTRLERQLKQVPMGSIVTITHAGKKKVGKGRPAHVYTVVLED